ncbi:hypothetical protein AH06_65 [Erwinia phage AH06]|nr:hypothetical protein AH06_65 [Erwinia phage AH06]
MTVNQLTFCVFVVASLACYVTTPYPTGVTRTARLFNSVCFGVAMTILVFGCDLYARYIAPTT